MRYPCKHCEYTATTAVTLKRHIKCIHEGVRYSCRHCEYAATTASDLKKHVKRKHK